MGLTGRAVLADDSGREVDVVLSGVGAGEADLGG